MRHPIRKIATQGAWYALGNALVKASGFFLLPVFTNAHFLPVADYGRWGVFEITIQIAVGVLGLSIPVGLVRYFREREGGEDAVAASWWMTVAVTALAAAAALVIVPRLLAPEYRAVGWILLAYAAFELLLAIPLALFRVEERAGAHTAVLGLKFALLVALALLLMVHRGQGLEGMATAYAAASGTALAAALVVARRPAFAIPRIPREIAGRMLAFSLPLIVGSVGSIALNAADRYVIALYRSPEEIAVYTLAGKIGGVVNMFVVQPFNLAWLPLLFRLDERQRPMVLELLLPYLAIALSLIALVLTLAAAPALALMRSDPSYRPALPLVPWIAFGFVFFGLSAVFTGVLALFHRTRTVSILVIAAAALNLALNFVFVPRFGAAAAAVNTFAAYAALVWVEFLIAGPLIRARYPWPRLIGIVGLSFAVSLVGAARPYTGSATDWLIRGALPLVWAGALWLTRWFTVREVRDAWRVLRSQGSPEAPAGTQTD